MKPRDFYHWVDEQQDLVWLGVIEGDTPVDDEVVVKNEKLHVKTAVALDAIRENCLQDLADMLYGKRAPKIMTHITRIVGYYSQLQNWNPSKIAELNDRHKGQYTLPELGDGNAENQSKVSPGTERCPAHELAGV